MQGGVVPGEFPQRAPPARALRLLPAHHAAPFRQPGRQQRQGIGSGQQQQPVLAGSGRRAALSPGQPHRQRRLQQGEVVELQGGAGKGAGHLEGSPPVGEIHHHLLPGHGRSGGHRDRREDAIGAVGVVESLGGSALQPQQPRLGFHRDHLQGQEVAGIA